MNDSLQAAVVFVFLLAAFIAYIELDKREKRDNEHSRLDAERKAKEEQRLKAIRPRMSEYESESGRTIEQPRTPPVQSKVVTETTSLEQSDSVVFIDLETTGLDPMVDRITEVAAILMNPEKTKLSGYSELVNPGQPLSQFIVDLTGITDEMLSKARPASMVLPELFAYMGSRTVVAYNAQFDVSFLKAEASRLGIELNNKSFCVLNYIKENHPGLRSYSLDNVCKAFQIEATGTSHRAGYDAERMVKVFFAAASRKPVVPLYGVYVHYTMDQVPFFVWTAQDGEPTVPENNYGWSAYVEQWLDSKFEIRCVQSGLTFEAAIDAKNGILAKHKDTLLNSNPFQSFEGIDTVGYNKKKQEYWDFWKQAKAKEKSNPELAVSLYIDSYKRLREFSAMKFEPGVRGDFYREMNFEANCIDALRLMERVSILLCRVGKPIEAQTHFEMCVSDFPPSANSERAEPIRRRIEKAHQAMKRRKS